jgi:hypothetical protein
MNVCRILLAQSHIQLTGNVRYVHTIHGLHVNPRGKRKLVHLTADRIRNKKDTGKVHVITGARQRPS